MMIQIFGRWARRERTEKSVGQGCIPRFYVRAGRWTALLLQRLENHLSPFQKKIGLLLFSVMTGTYFMHLIITGGAVRSATPPISFQDIHVPTSAIPADSVARNPRK